MQETEDEPREPMEPEEAAAQELPCEEGSIYIIGEEEEEIRLPKEQLEERAFALAEQYAEYTEPLAERENPRRLGPRRKTPKTADLPGMEQWRWEQVELMEGKRCYYLGTRYGEAGCVEGRAVAIPHDGMMPIHGMRGFCRVGQYWVLAQDAGLRVMTPEELSGDQGESRLP